MARTGADVTRAGIDTLGRRSVALARSTRVTAYDAWDGARDGVRGARETVSEFLEERPLAIGLLSAAAGIGLALALPRTRVEDEWVGERSDALKADARDAVAEQIEAARRGADDVVGRLVRDARARGLSQEAIAAAIGEFTAKLEKVGEAAADATEEEIDKAADRRNG